MSRTCTRCQQAVPDGDLLCGCQMVYGEWEWVPFVPITFYVPPVDPPATWPTNYVGRGVPPYTPTEEQPTRIGGEEA